MDRLFYTLNPANSSETDCKLGPMLDDGAPYSAIGQVELNLLTHNSSILDPLPKSISDFLYWQFGSGGHSSPAKPILGSTLLHFKSDS